MARPIDCLIGAGLCDSPYEELLKENEALKARILQLEERIETLEDCLYERSEYT